MSAQRAAGTDDGYGAEGGIALPFLLGAGAMRGQLVRLGPALDGILGPRRLPPRVAERLAETLALAAALAAALKYEGVFSLQIRADGPIGMAVADVTSGGDLRAYARFDAERLLAAPPGPAVPRDFGAGHLAFTVDQGPDTETYQGIVALEGDTLAQCADAYFRRSEQMASHIAMAVRAPEGGTGWRAGMVTLQRMPSGPGSPIFTAEGAAEAWNRAKMLLDTLGPDELLDGSIAPARLLHRLFHAERLAIFAPRQLRARCRCSSERVARTLRAFPRGEIEALRDTAGRVSVTCEFCGTAYVLGDAELERVYAAGA